MLLLDLQWSALAMSVGGKPWQKHDGRKQDVLERKVVVVERVGDGEGGAELER